MECEKFRVKLTLFIQFDDDSCEAHFSDESLLLMSPCGTQFQHVVPPGMWTGTDPVVKSNAAFGTHAVTQRTAFAISMFHQKVGTALNLRNRLAERVFVREQFLNEGEVMETGRTLREIRFPANENRMRIERHNTDGSWKMLSFDELSELTLQPDNQVISFRYPVRIMDDKSQSRSGAKVALEEQASKKRYARVLQQFTVNTCPRWTKAAVDLLLRTVASRGSTASAVKNEKNTAERPVLKDKECDTECSLDDVVLELPTSLSVGCMRPDLHATSLLNDSDTCADHPESSEVSPTSLEARLARKRMKVKVVIRSGSALEGDDDRTVYFVSDRALELLLSDGSYLRSKTRAGLFFTHWVISRSTESPALLETRVYSTDAPPVLHRSTSTPSKVLSLVDILRFARHLCDLLQPTFTMGQSRAITDTRCWYEQATPSSREESTSTLPDNNVLERFAVDGLLRSVTLTHDGKVRVVFDDRTLLETRVELDALRQHWAAKYLDDLDDPRSAHYAAWCSMQRFYAAFTDDGQHSSSETNLHSRSHLKQVAKPGTYRLVLRNGIEIRYDAEQPRVSQEPPAYLVYVVVGNAVCDWLATLPRSNRPDFAVFLEDRLEFVPQPQTNNGKTSQRLTGDAVNGLAKQLEQVRTARQRATVACELNKIERFSYRMENDGFLQHADADGDSRLPKKHSIKQDVENCPHSTDVVCNVEQTLANVRQFLDSC